jgi:hypothetical protein
MADKDLVDKLLKEIQPQLGRMHADHDRFMRLVAKMPPLSDDQKSAIAEANSPEGWQRALDEVTAKISKPQRKLPTTKEKPRPVAQEAKRLIELGESKQRSAAIARPSLYSRIFEKIRSRKEEGRCYFAAMKECDFIQGELTHLLDGFPALFLDTVMKEVRSLIRRTKSDLVKSVKKGLAYRTVVFLLISNVTWEQLRTGNHMVYRNQTSMMGDGLKGLFIFSSDCLVACGYQTQAEAEAEQEELFEMLRNLG